MRRPTDAEVARARSVDAAAETAWGAVVSADGIPAARERFIAAAVAIGETPLKSADLADLFGLVATLN